MAQQQTVHLHFRTDVETRRSAETCLIGQGPGSFVTWRLTDESYFISYISAAAKGVEHLPVQRLPGARGGYVLTQSLDGTRFPTLEALVASKLYLRHSVGEGVAGSAGGGGVAGDGASGAGDASASTVRRRYVGAPASSDTGGASSVPAALLAARPKRKKVVPASDAAADVLLRLSAERAARGVSVEDDEDPNAAEIDDELYERGVPPFLPAPAHGRLLGAFTLCGVTLLLLCGALWAAFDAQAHREGARLALDASAAVDAAMTRLYASLAASALVGNSSSSARNPAADLVPCEAAVRAWRGELAESTLSLQAGLDSALAGGSSAVFVYLAALAAAAAVAVPAALGLMCVHSGRPPTRLDHASMAEDAARDGPGPRPLCRPMQAQWVGAFWACVAAAGAAAGLLASLLWTFGGAVTALEHAARTLALTHPFSGLHPSAMDNYVGGIAARDAALALLAGLGSAPLGAVARGEAAGLARAVPVAWRMGVWASGPAYAALSRECTEAVQPLVVALANSPAVLRLPLAPHLGGAVWGSRGDDVFSRADPLRALPLLRGWLDVGMRRGGVSTLGVVLPSQSVLSEAGIVLIGVFVLAAMGLLVGVDAWHTTLRPALRYQWWKWRAQWGAKRGAGAAPAAAPAAGGDAKKSN